MHGGAFFLFLGSGTPTSGVWFRTTSSDPGKVFELPQTIHFVVGLSYCTKSLNAGLQASTTDVEQALVDDINEQRKEHRGCGKNEVMKKVLELKPDALGGLSATATPDKVLNFHGVAVAEKTPRASGFNSSTFFITSFSTAAVLLTLLVDVVHECLFHIIIEA